MTLGIHVTKSSSVDRWLSLDGSSVGSLNTDTALNSLANNGAWETNQVVDAIQLSSTKAVIAYYNQSTSDQVDLAVVDLSTAATPSLGTSVSAASSTSGNDGRSYLTKLSSSKFLFSYTSDAGQQTVKSYTVSGTTITADASATVGSANDDVSQSSRGIIEALSSTLALITYGDGTNTKIGTVSIGTSTLSVDTTHTLNYANASYSGSANGWALKSLGNGTHAILTLPSGTSKNIELRLIKCTAYAATPTQEASQGSITDMFSGITLGVRPVIMVESTSRVIIGLPTKNSSAQGGILFPVTVDTVAPSITSQISQSAMTMSVVVPYGFLGGDLMKTTSNSSIILVAGNVPRKADATKHTNITALSLDASNNFSVGKTLDFAANNHATVKQCTVVKITESLALLIYLQNTTRYPRLRTINI